MYSIFPVSAKPKEDENNQNRVSAYLYEATKNQTYRDAASSSQRFIQTQLMDTTTGLVRDLIDLSNCRYENELILTYNTGLYLEAVSVLWDITRDNNLKKM